MSERCFFCCGYIGRGCACTVHYLRRCRSKRLKWWTIPNGRHNFDAKDAFRKMRLSMVEGYKTASFFSAHRALRQHARIARQK